MDCPKAVLSGDWGYIFPGMDVCGCLKSKTLVTSDTYPKLQAGSRNEQSETVIFVLEEMFGKDWL
jgi:hypothetical protein